MDVETTGDRGLSGDKDIVGGSNDLGDFAPGNFNYEPKRWFIEGCTARYQIIWQYKLPFRFVMSALREAVQNWEKNGCRGSKPYLVMETLVPPAL